MMSSNASPFFTQAQEARMSTITAPLPAVAPVSTTQVPLTLKDRCDRCGSQAWLRATFNGVDLLFCGHHAKAHLGKLEQTSAQIHSELAKLEATHGPNAIREAIAAEETAKK